MTPSIPHSDLIIRAMIEADIPRLPEIRPGFTSPTVLDVERIGQGLEAGWRLIERTLTVPYDKGDRYDFDSTEQANIRARLGQGDGLHLVAEQRGRLVGILDVSPQEWNHTVWLWNIMLDSGARRQGLGRTLFTRAVTWGRRQGYRALCLETQTNNVPACKFYIRMGCQLDGIRETYYTNHDLDRHEVAIFFSYPLA